MAALWRECIQSFWEGGCMTTKPEIWKDIPGFEGLYQVSSHGRVRSLDTFKKVYRFGVPYLRKKKGRILKPVKHTNGYLVVQLGRGNRRFVHRLVAEAFIENPEHKPAINHKNGIKTDNTVENLEWVTYSENQIHAKRTGLAPTGEAHPQAKLSNKAVLFIKENYKPFHPLFGAKPLAEKFGVDKSTICEIAKGIKRKHA